MDGARPRPVVGLDRGLVAANPCERGGRLYRGSRAEKIWTAADEAAFLDRAPAHLHLPLLLALWTGQRQGDLLRLPWSAYDGTHIRLRQGKTGGRVVIPVGAPLKAALDAAPKRSPIILTNSDGKPWTSDGFRASWGKACKAAGVVGVTFHDLRGTAVTRLAAGRLHRGGDRHHHRALAARRARDPRYALPRARSGARRERYPKARKRNKISQLTSQLVWDVLWEEREKLSEINGGRTRARTWDPLIKSLFRGSFRKPSRRRHFCRRDRKKCSSHRDFPWRRSDKRGIVRDTIYRRRHEHGANMAEQPKGKRGGHREEAEAAADRRHRQAVRDAREGLLESPATPRRAGSPSASRPRACGPSCSNYYTRAGRDRCLTIGQFPDWSTTAARAKARELRRLIDDGGDPLAEIEAERAAPTVAELIDRFEQEHLPRKRPRTARDYRRMLANHIRPHFGPHTKVADVTFADVDALHRKITKSGATYAANRCRRDAVEDVQPRGPLGHARDQSVQGHRAQQRAPPAALPVRRRAGAAW